jgi:tetratricopeptide (TPR) repeat protein
VEPTAAAPVTLAASTEKLPAPAVAPPAQATPAAPVKVAQVDDSVPVGQIPGRPVGGEHAEGYDPRDARKVTHPVRSPVDTLLIRGRDLLATGEFEKARGVFLEALAKEPSRPEAYNGVGASFYGRLDLDEALAWYKRALETDPKFGDAYYNIACAYALLHRKPLAFRYLRLAALNRYFEGQKFQDDPDLESLLGEPEMKELIAEVAREEKADQAEKASRKGKPGKPPGSARP